MCISLRIFYGLPANRIETDYAPFRRYIHSHL
nr:MAG TPA: hypothetical protein [Caudoviricetes sp.]DAL40787.1 MAG TPA_asm: hypothetical protein [Caudoviricetes sp.]